jgi:hypothetical protein
MFFVGGYYKLRNDFEDWLFGKPASPGNFKDNLEACVYWYNHEGDPKSDNVVKTTLILTE